MKSLVLVITTRCQLQCKHCLKGVYQKHTDINLELLSDALYEAKDMGVTAVSLTGGEAGLHPKFDALLDIIVHKYDLKWSLMTNGWDTKHYQTSIKKYSSMNKFISVSFDGADAKTHDAIRQPGSFNRARKSLNHYKEIGLSTKIAYTINAYNYHQLKEIMMLGIIHQVDEIRFAGLIPNEKNIYLKLTDSQKLVLKSSLEKLAIKDFPFKISTGTCLYTVANPDHFCSHLNNPTPVINSYGEYIFCCDTANRGPVIGNLKDETFGELYIKQIKKGVWLKKQRQNMIANNITFSDFNSCYFCNKMMDDIIMPNT